MSFTGKLAELVIEFTTKGVDVFQKSMSAAKADLEKIGDSAKKTGDFMAGMFVKPLMGIGAFAAGGLYASAVWQQFSFVIERLARSIAGLFGPEIRKVLELLQRFSNWIEGLNNHQRAMIAHLIEAAAAVVLVGKAMPYLFSGIQMVVGGIVELIAGASLLDVLTGGILPAIGMLVTVFVALGVATGVAGGALEGIGERLEPLIKMLTSGGAKILEKFQPAMTALSGMFDSLLDGMEQTLPALMDIAGELADALIPLIQAAGQLVQDSMPVWVWLIKAVAVTLEYTLIPAMKLVTMELEKWSKLFEWIFGKQAKADVKIKAEGDHSALPKRVGGMESIDAMWKRIAEASKNVGGIGVRDKQDVANDHLFAIERNTGGTRDGIANIKPALA